MVQGTNRYCVVVFSSFLIRASSVGLYATDPTAMERLAQYMARPPISLSKVLLEQQGGKVLSHTRYNPFFRQSLKLFTPTDFIAELLQHVPQKRRALLPPLRPVLIPHPRYLETLSPPPAPVSLLQATAA